MPRFIVATFVAVLFLLAGPVAANASTDTTSDRPVFGTPLVELAGPDYVGREKVIGPAILGVVAVRIILKQVIKKGARLSRGARRVARPAARVRLTAKAIRGVLSESRRWVKLGDAFVKIKWPQLDPATQGCILGVAVSKAQDFPKGPDPFDKVEYYQGIVSRLFKLREAFPAYEGAEPPQATKLAREFNSVALSTVGACAAGAASGYPYKVPPGF